MHYGRGSQNTRDLPEAGDLRNFSAIFGKATKLIGTVWMTFVKFQKISSRSSLKLPVTWFQRDISDVCKNCKYVFYVNLLRDYESWFVRLVNC